MNVQKHDEEHDEELDPLTRVRNVIKVAFFEPMLSLGHTVCLI